MPRLVLFLICLVVLAVGGGAPRLALAISAVTALAVVLWMAGACWALFTPPARRR